MDNSVISSMKIKEEYIKGFVDKEISKTGFLILCYYSHYNKWPDKEHCLTKYKIKKSNYYKSIKDAQVYSKKMDSLNKAKKSANKPK